MSNYITQPCPQQFKYITLRRESSVSCCPLRVPQSPPAETNLVRWSVWICATANVVAIQIRNE
ncbi:hypothetical protein Lalb_Chr19g0135501 [Lupinus albus]|uniref:Uncharacterized protein n=1 Tax=Lupinus albus TaxID=3870 RepID=A0A6A4NQP2_LUPAL|nr:hypothetical protein Lalb_Chr19g0135501 [Lupinus albus]